MIAGQGWGRRARAVVVCVLLTALVVVLTPRRTTIPGPAASWRADAARLRDVAAYPTYAPSRVPESWWPVQSLLTGVNAPPLAWRVDFVVPGGGHAALAESDEDASAFASRMANIAAVSGRQRIGGTTWQRRYREDKDQRSLVRRAGKVTLVVTGTATWHDLTRLAASLQARPGRAG